MTTTLARRLTVLAAIAVLPLAALGATANGPASAVPASGYFERTATYPVYLNRPAGEQASAQTVAEISAVTPDGRTLVYTDALAKRVGFLDITDPGNPVGRGTLSLATLGDVTDEPTSVAIVGDYLIVVVNTSPSLTAPSGRADVIRVSDRAKVASIDLGGQPDSITISKNGAYAAIAMENERDESVNGGAIPQLPAGFVQILSLGPEPTAWTATPVTFDPADLTAAALNGPTDAEPEYVSINEASTKVAVTLQENNGIALIDLVTKSVEKVFSAGTVTLSGIDTTNDSVFNPTGGFVDRAREPDSIAWVGDDLVATANEGDLVGGTRGWTVFRVSTGLPVWDAGASLERLALRNGLFINSRAASKGTEPEGLAFATIGGTPYAFVGSERSNFVAVYDMSDPLAPLFRQILPATNGPEGILPIPGRNLLAVSSETDNAANLVRASVSLYRLGAITPFFPSIASTGPTPSEPIGWGALGALSASPTSATTLFTASDSAFKPARIYTVDAGATPARITAVTEVTDATGARLDLDVEGLAARPAGGFWLASEGATGPGNKLYRTDADGVVQQTVDLPTEVISHVKNWGLEGITLAKGTTNETVLVALQRTLWVDPSVAAASLVPLEGNVARIGRYDTVTGVWSWYTYPLATTTNPVDWIGLSEIVSVDADTLALIERDKLNGPDAAIKQITTVDLAGTGGTNAAPTPLTKRLVRDVLPDLRATHGWTQEKLEGLTIAADGTTYAVTDNDGLANATGETLFLRLGALFAAAPTVPRPTPTPTPLPAPTTTRTKVKAPDRATVGERFAVKVRVAGAETGVVRLITSAGVRRTLALEDGRAQTRLRGREVGALTVVASYLGSATASGSISRLDTVRITRR